MNLLEALERALERISVAALALEGIRSHETIDRADLCFVVDHLRGALVEAVPTALSARAAAQDRPTSDLH